MLKLTTKQKGSFAEELVSEYLKYKGFKILKRNWYCTYGEIDIIAEQKDKLVFVEVKFVSNTKFCKATDLFTYKKRKHLYRTIGIYLKQHNLLRIDWRVDLLCVTYDRNRYWTEHYTNLSLGGS
jgi:putative endonuclease